jgi:enolase-phosphatase E1
MPPYILTDIEGTTTSVSFVYQTLFPYFLEHLSWLEEAQNETFIAEQLDKVAQTVLAEEHIQLDRQGCLDRLAQWTRQDRKHPALKALQGWVWQRGYEDKTLHGHLYPDVPQYLHLWKNQGIQLGIYSSGSVPAQQLLFGYSAFGDLRPLISHYFDTAVGHKREQASYQNIAQAIGLAPKDILFLSDIEAELDAAAAAGMQTIQLMRPGNQASNKHAQAADFAAVHALLSTPKSH